MIDFLRVFQLDIMLFLSGVCAVLVPLTLILRTLSTRRKWLLTILEISASLLLIFDRFAYLYRGDVSPLGYWMVRVSNFLVFALQITLLISFNHYLMDLLRNEGGMKKSPVALVLNVYFYAAALLLLIISQFTGLYYTFDEQNRYQRSPLMILGYVFPSLIMILLILTVLVYRKKFRGRMALPLLLFSLLPFIATLAQFFLYGLSLTNLTAVWMVIVLYFFALHDMGDAFQEARKREIRAYQEEEKQIYRLFQQTAEGLATAIDAKDRYTHGHSTRVADYSLKIARALGRSEDDCQKVYFAGLLHDVGKIGISDAIITKDGKLTDEEFDQIKLHTVYGNRILSRISESPYLSIGAHHHHERYDGRGYPDGLRGEDIPEIARIIAVADSYDAMTSKRSYRDPLPQQKVREEIFKGIGTQFDPVFARQMITFIDQDTNYTLREGDSSNQAVTTHLECGDLFSECTEGIKLQNRLTRLRLYSRPDPAFPGESSLPSLVLFDALDGRMLLTESRQLDLLYYEYAWIRVDGKIISDGTRRVSRTLKETSRIPRDERTDGTRYEIQAVRQKDHVLIRIDDGTQTQEIILALPDSSRFAYLAVTGSHCSITGIHLERDEEPVSAGYIPRIAPFISFTEEEPEGDVPSVQIDGWRTETTRGIPLKDQTVISFHARSLPAAHLVWHCPFILLFTSLDGLVSGKEYREFSLIRLDGETWESDGHAENDIHSEQTARFRGWKDWKEKQKEGLDVTITLTREGKTIRMTTENLGIALNTRTEIRDDVDDIYAAITGDQCVVTNIRVTHAPPEHEMPG